MSDIKKAASGAVTDTSGSVTDETSTSGDAPSRGSDDLVLKLKKEKENWRTKALELETKLKTQEETELKAKENYKQLYEAEKKARETVHSELESLRQKEKQAKVNSALRKELFKYGLAQEHLETALKLIDRDVVQLDPDTDVVIGAELAAKNFHEKNSALGFFKKVGTGVNQVGSTQTMKSGHFNMNEFNKLTNEQKWEYLRNKTKS